MKFINTNLLSLKCLLFFFFGGMGCLFPFLPMHMQMIGLTLFEARVVSIVSPLVALLGPLLLSPLADRLGGAGSRTNASPMRAMLAVCMFLSAACYALLMCVPTVTRLEPRLPAVSFTCDSQGAAVLQEHCMEPSCYQWPKEKVGALLLSNCHYDCQTAPAEAELDELPETTIFPDTSTEVDLEDDYDDGSGALDGPVEVDLKDDLHDENKAGNRRKRNMVTVGDEDPPHLCFRDSNNQMMCNVYTEFSSGISLNASLQQANNSGGPWCRYPLWGNFSCRIPPAVASAMEQATCRVVCDIEDPYTATGSLLAQSQCRQMIGDPVVTFWSYLLVRSVADIFPTAAVGLLDAAVVIATRETSAGRGDVGRQLAFGSLGFAVFSPLVGLASTLVSPDDGPAYFIAFVSYAALMVVSALIVLFAKTMPLSPPEWWWHARGMRLGTVRRYGGEIAALSFVLLLLGALWSAMDSYLPWHLTELEGSWLLIGLTLTVGALPAIPLLWNAERVVDYCGHSNLLITAFTFYIIRYTGLSFLLNPWWILIFEALEVFTLSLMWVTAIMYLRHLVPRHLTATGQGLAVIAHFCMGRFLGAVIAAVISSYADVERGSLVIVYRVGAVAAAVIASIYFVVYHCCLKPRCLAPNNTSARNPQAVQGPQTNGTYTPLRVYHDGRGQKGQFRY